MKARSLLFCAALATAAGCGTPFNFKATTKTSTDTLSVYALSDAPPEAPTAINTFLPAPVPAEPSQQFDVVFDIHRDSASGADSAFIIPAQAIGAFGSAGVQKDTVDQFDAIVRAPTVGYDSTPLPIRPGDIVLIRAASYACSGQVIQQRLFIYSKLAVDSINFSHFDPLNNPAGGAIYFHMLVDPNCGFLSLKPDTLPSY